jgi:hypothetical protein
VTPKLCRIPLAHWRALDAEVDGAVGAARFLIGHRNVVAAQSHGAR